MYEIRDEVHAHSIQRLVSYLDSRLYAMLQNLYYVKRELVRPFLSELWTCMYLETIF